MDRRVFINYRGEDSHSYGALLYTELARQFGADRVFLDCESIPAGADFGEELLGRVRSAQALLAVIGPRWLTAADPSGGRRLDNPADWIRRELAEAFAAGVRVIPVLIEQVAIPAAADLPADIAALSRCQYRRLRHRDPTADLARIVTDLISLDPTLAASTRGRADMPRQLPAAPSMFTGRAAELATLTGTGMMASDVGATVVISAIHGVGGIGKTWLALDWAHRNLHCFPDGQLFVDLRGFSPAGRPAHPSDVLGGFLDALGVGRDRQPQDLDRRAELYRSVVVDKRMLVVLDNAATTEQVIPLLPGGRHCTVLITSRNHLRGLVARYGARPVRLDVFTDTEAHTLLSTALGADRVDADRQAVAELIELCGGFPLALGLIAARATANPDLPLNDIVAELRAFGVDALDSEDPTASLPAVLSGSLRQLEYQQRQVFVLLGIAPGPDIGLLAAASLTGLSNRETHAVLRALADASLIGYVPGGRYVMHDLVRAYATTIAEGLPAEVRETALQRVLDFYLHTAHAAAQLLDPHHDPAPLAPPTLGVRPHSLPDVSAVLAWFDTEHACLLAAQHTAIVHHWHPIVWRLASALHTVHRQRGHRHDQLTVWQAAADAAVHLPDPATRTLAHRYLGSAHAELGHHQDALDHLQQALTHAEYHHDSTGQAHIHRAIARAWELKGDDRQALDHARRALDLCRGQDQPVREANALGAVGWYAARLGDYDTARVHCQAALTLHRRHHNTTGEATTLSSLGYIDHHTGRHTQAINHYRHALTLLRDLGNTYQAAITLDLLGHPYAALGQAEQARAAWLEAVQLYREQGRDDDATCVQHQLDNLDHQDGIAQ